MNSVRNKQDQLEALALSHNYNVFSISELWWNESHNCRAGMESYRLFRMDLQGRQGRGVALHVREKLDLKLGIIW